MKERQYRFYEHTRGYKSWFMNDERILKMFCDTLQINTLCYQWHKTYENERGHCYLKREMKIRDKLYHSSHCFHPICTIYTLHATCLYNVFLSIPPFFAFHSLQSQQVFSCFWYVASTSNTWKNVSQCTEPMEVDETCIIYDKEVLH